MDERATRIFSRMDERATQMSEWIEERMWLLETVDQEEPGNWSHFDRCQPWNLVGAVTLLLFFLFIFLIEVIMNGGYIFAPPLS